MNFWIFAFCAITFMTLLNPFIKLWLGQNYVLSLSISIALAISFFIEGLRNPCYTYRITLGLFEKGKITPYIATIVNIVSSVILCKIFGTVGIFIGTSLAQLSSYSWIDAYLIHKYEFKTSVKKYFEKYVKYFIVFVISYIATYFACSYIEDKNFITLIIKGIFTLTIPNLIIFLIYRNSYEYKELKKRILQLAKDKIRR